ncbi:MAG: hypothetical protein DMF93_24805 [Acidobacteria bacterium]|nr:MAG: hypothetical protein DMF93_24805 [Acidobacteriota bacterium]
MRVDRGRKRLTRIELQRAHDPRAQAGRQRLEAAARRNRPRRRDDFAEPRGQLVVGERASEDQRERDGAELRDVRAMIERRGPARAGQRHAQLLPVAFARELQLAERGAEHVLDHHDARGRRDDDPLGRDRAVRDVARLFVQHRHRGHDLPQQAERRVDVERHGRMLGEREHLGEAHAGGDVGDEDERRRRILEPFDAADVRVAAVPERAQMADALAQRELEGGDRRQLAAQAQELDRLVPHWIGRPPPHAKTVREGLWRWRANVCRGWFHTRRGCGNCAVAGRLRRLRKFAVRALRITQCGGGFAILSRTEFVGRSQYWTARLARERRILR